MDAERSRAHYFGLPPLGKTFEKDPFTLDVTERSGSGRCPVAGRG